MIVVEGGARHLDREVDVVGDARPPDRGRPDDLRPAAPRSERPARTVRADAIVVAAGARAADGRRRQAARAPIGGRPLLAWTLDALASASPVERLVVVVAAPDRVAEVAAAPWLPAVRRRRRGGRRAAPGIGRGRGRRARRAGDATRATSCSSTTARGRSSTPASSSAVAEPPPGARRGDPGRAGRRDAQAGRRRAGRAGPSTGRPGGGPDAAGRPPRPAARGLRTLSRPAGPRPGPTRPPCSRPVASPVHVVPGDSDEPQGDAARRPRRGPRRRARADPPVRRASGHRPRQPPVRAGRRRCALGGIAIDGAPRLHGHSDGDVALHAVADALLGAAGARRPRAALPGRARRRRPGSRAASSSPTCRRRVAGAGFAPGVGRPDDRRGPAAARRAISTRCGGDRRRCSGSPADRVNVKASTRQPGRRRGRRARDLRPGDRGRRRRSAAWRRPVTPRLHDTLTRRDAAARAARARARPHLLLRSDRLRPGPHRQLPVVPVRRPARPPPALARPTA